MKTNLLLNKLGRLYPKRIALKNKDVVGFMAGQKVKEINKIVLLLDLDDIVLDEALRHQPDLILTHHPFIYGTRAKVFKRDEKKALLAKYLDTLPLMVYSMHTNFDEAPNGMNDALAEKLGLIDIKPLQKAPMARGGRLEKAMPRTLFSQHAIKVLDAQYGLLVDAGKEMIETVAIIGGGGSRSWSVAQEEGYDIYISGDAPHYVRRDIMNAQYNYLDLPHEIENIFLSKMKEVLLRIDSNLEIITIKHEFPPKLVKVE